MKKEKTNKPEVEIIRDQKHSKHEKYTGSSDNSKDKTYQHHFYKDSSRTNFFSILFKNTDIFGKIKLIIAILLDLVDLVIANIPLLNSIWDLVTMVILFFTLKNKSLAVASMSEIILPGIPFLGQIDALIPMATILTLIDIFSSSTKKQHNYHKNSKKNTYSKMKKVN